MEAAVPSKQDYLTAPITAQVSFNCQKLQITASYSYYYYILIIVDLKLSKSVQRGATKVLKAQEEEHKEQLRALGVSSWSRAL